MADVALARGIVPYFQIIEDRIAEEDSLNPITHLTTTYIKESLYAP